MGRFLKFLIRAARLGRRAARRIGQLERRIERNQARIEALNRRFRRAMADENLERAREIAIEQGNLQRGIDDASKRIRNLEDGLPETNP